MERANILIKDNNVELSIPISKSNIDEERRIVSGWATVDNVDQMLDKVSADASLNAFSKFRGNVREMHDKHTAVGKVVHFNQQPYVADDGTSHTGIYVDVYISKGAESTWQKVLDGTLTAFSVRGPIKEVSKQYLADYDRLVQVVTDYDLIELSLVDNPGNELCNVMSISKSNEGIAANVVIDTVYWCSNDRIAVTSATDELTKCAICAGDMESIGWFEPTEEVSVKDSITKILQANNKLEKTLNEPKGGSEMTEEVNKDEEVVTTPESVEEDKQETEVETETPEVPVAEVEVAEEPDLVSIGKSLEAIQDAISKASAETRTETLAEIQKAVAAVETSVNDKLTDLQKSYAQLESEVKVVKEGLGTVEKSLNTVSESLEKSSAIKKSLDTDAGDVLEKGTSKSQGFWSSNFLPSNKSDQ